MHRDDLVIETAEKLWHVATPSKMYEILEQAFAEVERRAAEQVARCAGELGAPAESPVCEPEVVGEPGKEQ